MKTTQTLAALIIVIMAASISLSGMTALIIIQSIIAAVVISLAIVIAFRKGRPIVFATLMVSALSSCSKESVPQPQTITYEVWCDNCYIFLEDDDINRNVVEELHEYKNFNVSGYFRYEFINDRGIDVVFATVLVSVYYPHDQRIVVRITDSESGNIKEVSKDMTSSDSERISFEMEI